MLSCFVGYYVVLKVTPALHAPLMSVTNAISSVIAIAALECILTSTQSNYPVYLLPFGMIAIFLTSINIVGGFMLTKRMLSMFSRKRTPQTKMILCLITCVVAIAISRFLDSMLVLIVPSALFILSLRGLSSAQTAERGNLFGMLGMGLVILSCLVYRDSVEMAIPLSVMSIGGAIGFYIAKKIDMTALPQLVAAFHSLVGLAAVFIAGETFMIHPETGVASWQHILSLSEMSIGAAIGAITFTGSVVAWGKLQGFINGKPFHYPFQNKVNLLIVISIIAMIVIFITTNSSLLLISIIAASLVLGFLLVIPIGGADMPVIVSMLNSYSGWAATGIGFTLEDHRLIIVGALVGTSGMILSSIMCKGMNRSLFNVILGGLSSGTTSVVANDKNHGNVKLCSPEDAAYIMKNSSSVIVVPGYGMAVAQAQHAIKELAEILKHEGVSVRYAIHPVAGRMPGHMNVLLAESNIPYEDVFEIDEINHEFGSTDVAIIIGANDITNPAAKNDPASPIYGMPVLDVEKAKTVLFVKRSLGAGYAGIDNQLFYQSNTMMLLGDAKKVIEGILKEIRGA
ncbi:MAG: NAD(P)(+) transhydrogenase (Re/Si-specific) subunit beta [Holosporales bacterium]|nr:NAD(P)(+) transhydrogenase (Re/Si-specific) subunit beta [Holosporales bacterium]